MTFEAGQFVRALFDFPTTLPGEVSLQAGEVVQLTGVVDASWLRGRLPRSGQEGHFPASYVEAVPVPAVAVGQKVFLALDDFPGQEAGDLSLSRGEVVIGLEAVDESWWRGKCGPLRGIFPLTLVVELTSLSSSLAPTGRHIQAPSQGAAGSPGQGQEEGLARALVDTTPQLGGELGLVAGDILTIKEAIDADWFLGECRGRRGLVPAFCVELLTDAPLPGSSAALSGHSGSDSGDHRQSSGGADQAELRDRPPAEESGRRRQNSLLDYVYSSADQGSEATTPSYYTSENTRSHDAEVTPYARTLYPFVAENANELSFEANEIVTLIQHIDGDWIEGELDGRLGLFPTGFVEIIVDCPYATSGDAPPPPDQPAPPSAAEVSVQTADRSAEKLGLVLHNFQANVDGDLSVSEGDTITVMEFLDSNWVRGRDENGNVGLVPLNHLEVIGECPVTSAPVPSETSSLNGTECLSPASPGMPKSVSWSDFNDNRVKPSESQAPVPLDANGRGGEADPSPAPTSFLTDRKSVDGFKQPVMADTPSVVEVRKPDLRPKPLAKPKLAPKPILKSKPVSLRPKPSLQSGGSERPAAVTSPSEKKLRSAAFTTLDSLISEEMKKSKEEAESRSRSSSSLSSGSRDSQEISSTPDSLPCSKRESGQESEVSGLSPAASLPPNSAPQPGQASSSSVFDADSTSSASALPPASKALQPDVPKRVSFGQGGGAPPRPRPKSQLLQASPHESGETTPPGLRPGGCVNDAYTFDADEILVSVEGTQRTAAPSSHPPSRPALTRSRSLGGSGGRGEPPRKPAPPRPTGPRVAAAPPRIPLTPAPVCPPVPSHPASPAPGTAVQVPKHPAPGAVARVPSRPAPPRPESASPRKPPPRPKLQPQSADLMSFSPDSSQDRDVPRRSSIFYVPLPDDPDISSDLNAEIIADLRQRIKEVERDLEKFEAMREAAQQQLQQSGDADREEALENLADVEANVAGLSEELSRLRESLCQISPEDEKQEQLRQQRQREMQAARLQQLEEMKKRREKREKVMQELLVTEKDYLCSLQLCLATFLSLPNKPASLDVDKVLGNMEEIAEVSQRLLTCLETALNGKEFHEQIIGTSFLTLAEDMKNTYAPYCRNHDEVITLMEKYKEMPEMREYFGRLVEKMRMQSNVFDLEAQLIKPVQRILKYPLLLNELFKATEEDHPDREAVLKAINAVTDVAGAINEYKRRKDLVYKYKRETDESFSDKIAKLNFHSIKKKSSRIRGRLSTGLGISLMTRDEKFEKEEGKFRLVEKASKIYVRNVQTYMEQLQETLMAQESMAVDISEFYGVKATVDVQRYKEIQTQVCNALFLQFRQTVEDLVVTPLNKLMSLFVGPNHVIDKRFDKLLDYDNLSRKAKDPDRASEVQKVKNDYEAMNAQLLDELPQLYSLATALLNTCMGVFSRAQHQFTDAALKEMYKKMQVPLLVEGPEKLVEAFNAKHLAALDQVSTLSFIPRGFNPRMDAIRQERQPKRQSMDSATGARDAQPSAVSESESPVPIVETILAAVGALAIVKNAGKPLAEWVMPVTWRREGQEQTSSPCEGALTPERSQPTWSPTPDGATASPQTLRRGSASGASCSLTSSEGEGQRSGLVEGEVGVWPGDVETSDTACRNCPDLPGRERSTSESQDSWTGFGAWMDSMEQGPDGRHHSATLPARMADKGRGKSSNAGAGTAATGSLFQREKSSSQTCSSQHQPGQGEGERPGRECQPAREKAGARISQVPEPSSRRHSVQETVASNADTETKGQELVRKDEADVGSKPGKQKVLKSATIKGGESGKRNDQCGDKDWRGKSKTLQVPQKSASGTDGAGGKTDSGAKHKKFFSLFRRKSGLKCKQKNKLDEESESTRESLFETAKIPSPQSELVEKQALRKSKGSKDSSKEGSEKENSAEASPVALDVKSGSSCSADLPMASRDGTEELAPVPPPASASLAGDGSQNPRPRWKSFRRHRSALGERKEGGCTQSEGRSSQSKSASAPTSPSKTGSSIVESQIKVCGDARDLFLQEIQEEQNWPILLPRQLPPSPLPASPLPASLLPASPQPASLQPASPLPASLHPASPLPASPLPASLHPASLQLASLLTASLQPASLQIQPASLQPASALTASVLSASPHPVEFSSASNSAGRSGDTRPVTSVSQTVQRKLQMEECCVSTAQSGTGRDVLAETSDAPSPSPETLELVASSSPVTSKLQQHGGNREHGSSESKDGHQELMSKQIPLLQGSFLRSVPIQEEPVYENIEYLLQTGVLTVGSAVVQDLPAPSSSLTDKAEDPRSDAERMVWEAACRDGGSLPQAARPEAARQSLGDAGKALAGGELASGVHVLPDAESGGNQEPSALTEEPQSQPGSGTADRDAVCLRGMDAECKNTESRCLDGNGKSLSGEVLKRADISPDGSKKYLSGELLKQADISPDGSNNSLNGEVLKHTDSSPDGSKNYLSGELLKHTDISPDDSIKSLIIEMLKQIEGFPDRSKKSLSNEMLEQDDSSSDGNRQSLNGEVSEPVECSPDNRRKSLTDKMYKQAESSPDGSRKSLNDEVSKQADSLSDDRGKSWNDEGMKEAVSSPHRDAKSSREAVSSPHRDAKSSREAESSPRRDAKSSREAESSPHRDAKSSREAESSPHGDAKSSREAESSPHRDTESSREAESSPHRDAKSSRDELPKDHPDTCVSSLESCTESQAPILREEEGQGGLGIMAVESGSADLVPDQFTTKETPACQSGSLGPEQGDFRRASELSTIETEHLPAPEELTTSPESVEKNANLFAHERMADEEAGRNADGPFLEQTDVCDYRDDDFPPPPEEMPFLEAVTREEMEFLDKEDHNLPPPPQELLCMRAPEGVPTSAAVETLAWEGEQRMTGAETGSGEGARVSLGDTSTPCPEPSHLDGLEEESALSQKNWDHGEVKDASGVHGHLPSSAPVSNEHLILSAAEAASAENPDAMESDDGKNFHRAPLQSPCNLTAPAPLPAAEKRVDSSVMQDEFLVRPATEPLEPVENAVYRERESLRTQLPAWFRPNRPAPPPPTTHQKDLTWFVGRSGMRSGWRSVDTSLNQEEALSGSSTETCDVLEVTELSSPDLCRSQLPNSFRPNRPAPLPPTEKTVETPGKLDGRQVRSVTEMCGDEENISCVERRGFYRTQLPSSFRPGRPAPPPPTLLVSQSEGEGGMRNSQTNPGTLLKQEDNGVQELPPLQLGSCQSQSPEEAKTEHSWPEAARTPGVGAPLGQSLQESQSAQNTWRDFHGEASSLVGSVPQVPGERPKLVPRRVAPPPPAGVHPREAEAGRDDHGRLVAAACSDVSWERGVDVAHRGADHSAHCRISSGAPAAATENVYENMDDMRRSWMEGRILAAGQTGEGWRQEAGVLVSRSQSLRLKPATRHRKGLGEKRSRGLSLARIRPKRSSFRSSAKCPGGSGEVEPQNEGQQAYLRQRYPEKLFRVSQAFSAMDAMDLSVAPGQLVAVLKEQDPMGNKEKWFVDNGADKGFIPRRVLVPEAAFLIGGGPGALQGGSPPTGAPHSTPPAPQGGSQPAASLYPAPTPSLTVTASPEEDDLDSFCADIALPNPAAPEASGDLEYYQALYNFASRAPNEVSLFEGQVVHVLSKQDVEGNVEWWHVDADGHIGYAPANYLQKMT